VITVIRKWTTRVLSLCALGLLLLPATAQGAFPGENGKIAFIGTGGITTMNPDGTGAAVLANGGFPAWSADGTRIAFRGGHGDIYVMNADGSGQTQLTNTGSEDSPAWSPDGERIAFQSHRDGDHELYVMNADGTNQVRLTNRPGWDAEPAWSPDGTKIAFVQGPADTGSPLELYVMNADGTGATKLPTALQLFDCPGDEKFDGSPNWSPDGQKLAFHHEECSSAAWRSINTINADGTGEQVVTGGEGSSVLRPAWSPDGTKIVFDDVENLYTINPDGTGLSLLRTGAGPDWQPLVGGPPDCSSVIAKPAILHPANDHFRVVTLSGATDPDGDPLSLAITGVTQDEPVGRRPDARRPVRSDRIHLRAERQNKGDGRVYRVAFTVSDGIDRCSGAVTVEVRRKKREPAVDSAPPSFDSFG
jgi:TolB protein